MITARNYAAQAQHDLNTQSQLLKKINKYPNDAEKVKALASMIGSAVHFVLPDGAKIIADKLQGIKNTVVRLPYPVITIEYFTQDDEYIDPTLIYVPKRLIVAIQTTKEVVEQMTMVSLKDTNDNWIIIFSIFQDNRINKWVPLSLGWALNGEWDNPTNTSEIKLGKNPSSIGITGLPFVFLADVLEDIDLIKREAVVKSVLSDIHSEVLAVLELCEALSCSNVTHEVMKPIDTAKNAKRIKQGKLPMYETRILVVRATDNKTYPNRNSGNTHKSPRQHLRRGHIRKLQNDKKVWVNPCIVGSSDNGVIQKQYQVIN